MKSGKHASLRGWCRKALRVRFPPGTPKPMTDGFSIVCCLCPGGAILADAVVSEATAARRCEFESRPGHQNLLQTGVSIVCLSCPDGGTGRRAGFRVQCPRRAGSSPVIRTKSKNPNPPPSGDGFGFFFVSRGGRSCKRGAAGPTEARTGKGHLTARRVWVGPQRRSSSTREKPASLRQSVSCSTVSGVSKW